MFLQEIGKMLGAVAPEWVLPRITLLGKNAVHVEGHRGVMLFNGEEVRLRVKGGVLVVVGEKLLLKRLSQDVVLVSGSISGVAYD